MVWGAAGEAGDRKGAEAAGEKRSFKEEEELEQMGRNGQSGRFWNYGSILCDKINKKLKQKTTHGSFCRWWMCLLP